jgi:alpha-tubulin suppressor-like RCC1 family protein
LAGAVTRAFSGGIPGASLPIAATRHGTPLAHLGPPTRHHGENALNTSLRTVAPTLALLAVLGCGAPAAKPAVDAQGHLRGSPGAYFYVNLFTPPVGGIITSDVGGIDCGASGMGTPVPDSHGVLQANPIFYPGATHCGQTQFAWSATVVLTATPRDGHAFYGWAGDCSGTGTCTLTAGADKSVVAIFGASGAGHANLADPALHGPAYADFVANGASAALVCTKCHGADLLGGSFAPSCAACHEWPIQVGSHRWTLAAAGGYHGLALKSDGSLWAWGRNDSGQLGDGTLAQKAAQELIGDGYSAISAGLTHSLAVTTGGTLMAWGGNARGQVGDGTAQDRNFPVTLGGGFTAVSAGADHSLALRADGALFAWGGNATGQLGDGTTVESHVPVLVGLGFNAVAAGNGFSLALKTDGSLWAWGANGSGQLGDGTTSERHSPLRLGGSYIAVAAGVAHAAALMSDQTLWTWGSNGFGQVGDGTRGDRHAPVQVGIGFAGVSAANHTVGVKVDGSVWAWGSNGYGQLGDGTTTDRSAPVSVGFGFKMASAGLRHTVGVKKDRTLWAWGDNAYGQVGDGTSAQRLSGVEAVGGPIASLLGTSLSFGVQGLGSSQLQSMTLSNPGDTDLLLSGLTISGSASADFALSGTCGAALGAGQSCTMDIRFAPLLSGQRTALLTLSTSDTFRPVIEVPLSGTGVLLPASGASLVPSLPSPQAVGTPVAFTAAGQGSINYQYRYSLYAYALNTWSVVQDYGPAGSWTLPDTTPAGAYLIAVDVRTSAAVVRDVQATLPFAIVGALPATGVTLSASPTGHTFEGTSALFSAAGQGATGYQYRFFLYTYSTAAWTLVQDYSPVPTWSLPGTAAIGDYIVAVDVRTTSGVVRDAQATMEYRILPRLPASGVTLTASPPNQASAGATALFTAAGQGSSGYQYRFFLYTYATGAWTMVQDYGSEATWSLPSSTTAGTYIVAVDVRTTTSVIRDAQATTPYAILGPPAATGVTLSGSPSAPVIAGNPATFTAVGQGSFNYQYRFSLYALGTWTVVQEYGPAATWTLPGTTPAGSYIVAVDVRTSSSVVRDAQATMQYAVVSPPPATGVTLSATPSAQAYAGAQVTFTAAGQGSSLYQYRFSLYAYATGIWSVVQDYGVTPTWSPSPNMVAGDYLVAVDVRTTTSVVRDAQATLPYRLLVPIPASGVSLVANPADQASAGTPVPFTAAGQGSAGYQYRFFLYAFATGTWALVQDYGPAATWTLPGSTAPGAYLVAVDVRTYTAVTRDAQSVVPYTLY